MNRQTKSIIAAIVFFLTCNTFRINRSSIVQVVLEASSKNKPININKNDEEDNDPLKELILLSSTNNSLSSDIDKIYHSPRKQEIHVHLTTVGNPLYYKRRCKSPKLRARLSGPYLALVTWDHDSIFANMNIDMNNHTSNDKDYDNDNDVNVIIGHYQVPKGGTYFIEIIAILCEAPRYHDNFTSTCLEDPNNSVISAYNATINVLDPPAPKPNTEDSKNNIHGPGKTTPGFWKWKGDLSENVTQVVTIQQKREYAPLITRFQPITCWNEKNKTTRNIHRCDEKEDRQRFLDYQFEWQNDTINDSLRIGRTRIGDLEQFKAKEEKICIFGLSHSHFIRLYSDDLLLTQNITFGGIITLIKYEIMPEASADLSKDYIDAKQKFNCTKGLVGFGQWPGSYDGGRPVLFWQYEQLMNRVVKTMREIGIEPIFRALHWIPVAARVGSCPPGDWRVHAMEGYNEILKKVGKELNVPYLDSEFIVAPMWDESADFNHVKDERAWREVNFIMRDLIKLQA